MKSLIVEALEMLARPRTSHAHSQRLSPSKSWDDINPS
jgi:hypothetical protein